MIDRLAPSRRQLWTGGWVGGRGHARGRNPPRFSTALRYDDRASKARYVWEKYRPLLEGRNVLDVGADAGHLRKLLDAHAHYWGIGWGPGVDEQVDLEQGPLGFHDGQFHCVVCCDVLEHLESAHLVFDELCRVASQAVILSLPNPWAVFWRQLRGGNSVGPLKFYGFPGDRPADRHRWFFAASEAVQFIETRADRNGWQVAQIDFGWPDDRPWLRRMARRRWLQRMRLLPQVDLTDLYASGVWAALVRSDRQGVAA